MGEETVYEVSPGVFLRDADEGCGRSVAMSSKGTVVAMGCPFYDIHRSPDPQLKGTNVGRVRVYELGTDDVWRPRGAPILGVGAYDRAGFKIDITASGDEIVVSGEKCLGVGPYRAHARVFAWEQEWVQRGGAIGCDSYLESGAVWFEDRAMYHSYDVAISGLGGRVAYANRRGWDFTRDNPSAPGITRVFELTDGWRQLGESIVGATEPDTCRYCSKHVAIDLNDDGDIVAVRSPRGIFL